MGYTTDFKGIFELNKELDDKTYNFLVGFSETRRMARSVNDIYGVQGEFYIEGEGFRGQNKDSTVIDNNAPPSTQPSLWCQWVPTKDRKGIEWDGGEKFYSYVEWLSYLINKILSPRGYFLNGVVYWRGEDFEDNGVICVVDNVIEATNYDKILPTPDYSINKLLGDIECDIKEENNEDIESLRIRLQLAEEKCEAQNKLLDKILKEIKKFEEGEY